MKKARWLVISSALTVAAILALSAPVLAQGGPGGGPRGKGNQWCAAGGGPGQGPGPGAAYCPNYPGYQSSPGYTGDNPQTPRRGRGMRGMGRVSQPDAQATPPAANQ
jgi:hypothetical protein